MANWIPIDPSGLNIADHRAGEFAGVEIVEGLSPDDIPEKIRGRVRRGKYIICFKYPTRFKERKVMAVFSTNLPSTDVATPVVGSHSGRLYELRFPGPTVQGLPQQVDSTVDLLSKDMRYGSRRRHYKVAGEAVSDNANALLGYP
jgi:hypothetical protein